ncbi:MAG: hypothetical protein M3R25_06085 [Bacteroidota bacterium]|nr:hypothetical protein [Bacteroidota bacterium]
MGKSWVGTLLLVFAVQWLHAQRIIINSNGDKIVMYPDGSWRSVEAGDSILLRQNLQKSESLNEATRTPQTSYQRNPGEIQEYILKQWNELHFHIKAQEKKVQGDFRAATNAKFKAEEQLNNALANKAMMEPDLLASLHETFDHSIDDLKKAKSNQAAIGKLMDMSQKIGGMKPDAIASKLNGLRSRFNIYLANYEPSKSLPASGPIVTNTPKPDAREISVRDPKDNSKDGMNVKPAAASYSEEKATYRSEPFNCKVTSDTVDEATSRRRIHLEKSLLFTHTETDLRPYFKDKELITCYGELSKIDAYVYLTIEFQIASSHSQSNFGLLQNGSLLRLKLLSGEYVSLYNIKSDRGRIDPYSGHTVFTGQYALGKDEIRMLQSSELDKVRILWSTGYEDYDVYKIDFFIDRLACLMAL